MPVDVPQFFMGLGSHEARYRQQDGTGGAHEHGALKDEASRTASDVAGTAKDEAENLKASRHTLS